MRDRTKAEGWRSSECWDTVSPSRNAVKFKTGIVAHLRVNALCDANHVSYEQTKSVENPLETSKREKLYIIFRRIFVVEYQSNLRCYEWVG